MMPRSTRSTRSGRPLPSHANAGELDNQVVESGHNGPERRDRILAIAEAALLSLVTLAAAYSGYAAAQWNGESAVLLIEASEARTTRPGPTWTRGRTGISTCRPLRLVLTPSSPRIRTR